MKTKEFHKLLADPTLVNASHVDELKTLVKLYPYFQAAHLLLAKAAKQADDEHFDKILKKAALHSGDRKSLFDLLMAAEIRRVVVEVDTEVDAMVQNDRITEAPQNIEPTVLPEPSLIHEEIEQSVTEPVYEIPEAEVTISATSVLDTVVEAESTIEIRHKEEIKPEEIQPEIVPAEDEALKALDREILFKAVYSTIEKEIQEDITDQIAEQDEESTYEEPVKHSPIKNEEQEEEDFAAIPPAHSAFTAWLLKRAEETHFIEVRKPVPEAKEIAQDRKVKEKHLVDDFIKKDPRIAPARLDQVSTENLGRSSIQESEALITETLAKVYVKQGKIEKAKKAYQLLSLKYPEKSIYFANQLKKLDEQT